MEQTKALNALEPFLALSKSATSPRAAADLIERATSAPNTYIFTELLESAQMQALASSPELQPHLSLLRIFSYGDYAAYEASSSSLPAINDAQRLKLRQLTLLSLAASGDRGNLTYDTLRANLGLPSARELETLVTTAIYAGLVEAKLDPARQRVQVTSVAPLRDLGPGDAAAMLAALLGWSDRCGKVLDDVEEHMDTVHRESHARAKAERETAEKLNKAVAEVRDHPLDKKLGPAAAREQLARRGPNKRSIMEGGAKTVAVEEIMDLDGPLGEDSKKRSSKRKM